MHILINSNFLIAFFDKKQLYFCFLAFANFRLHITFSCNYICMWLNISTWDETVILSIAFLSTLTTRVQQIHDQEIRFLYFTIHHRLPCHAKQYRAHIQQASFHITCCGGCRYSEGLSQSEIFPCGFLERHVFTNLIMSP